jgi:hypothetical protein
VERLAAGPLGQVDTDHLRAEVGKEHAAERSGPDAAELEHAYARKRAGTRGLAQMPGCRGMIVVMVACLT